MSKKFIDIDGKRIRTDSIQMYTTKTIEKRYVLQLWINGITVEDMMTWESTDKDVIPELKAAVDELDEMTD